MDRRNCYIFCHPDKYCTDIALAIYYMFHKPGEIPILEGHISDKEFKCNDIMQRLNTLYSKLTQKNAKNMALN